MVDKQRLYKSLIDSLEENCERMKTIGETSRDAACELEGRNQSRYDTMRIETSWVASGLDKRVQEVRKELAIAHSFSLPQTNGTVTIGSYVSCAVEGQKENYFILPFCGGRDVEDEDCEYLIVTPESPIAQMLMGKKDGEGFELRGRKYLVKEHC